MTREPEADQNETLGGLVTSTPGAAEVFETLGLDYCCGGAQSLGDACRRHGLDVQAVRLLLQASRAKGAGDGPDPHDLTRASMRELCEHIVVRHHGPLRVALTRMTKLLATVARVHGAVHPELVDLQSAFKALRTELEEHLLVEEETLFPACATLDDTTAAPLPDDVIEHLRDEHRGVGEALGVIRELCDGFDESRAVCASHRQLLSGLRSFELDMHQHVHEENNILFPRALAHAAPGP
ncbi:DUF542 domain-containing protein [Paraconexibacter sp.]|uniref:DUF542 domain-containing protein n=1 Tax=Paraconexibacter sp. TaxID=2949640 RepID=UPI003567D27B